MSKSRCIFAFQKIMMYKYFVFIIVLFISCKSEVSEKYSDTITRYEVYYKGDSLVIGKLNFKETKVFDEHKRLLTKYTFDKSGNKRGIEKITYLGDQAKSEYRLMDNSLLSTYEYKYENNFLLEKRSFDGANNELLRIEQFSYDDMGNQTEKIIMNANEIISRVFKFAFDDKGNELGFSVFNEEGELLMLETYKITEMDNENRWIKKWTERDSLIQSYYERKIEKIN